MLDDALDLLDRQFQALLEETDLEFALSIGSVLAALEGDPRIAVHIRDLEHEGEDLGRELQTLEYDQGRPGRLLERIWLELGNGLSLEQLKELLPRQVEFKQLLYDVEHPVVVPLDPTAGNDPTRVGRLVAIVARFDHDSGAKIIDVHRPGYEDLKLRQIAVWRHMLRITRTSPAIALLRLRCLAALDTESGETTVSSRPRETTRPALEVRSDAGGRSWSGLIPRVLQDEVPPDHYSGLAPMTEALRAATRRLGLELRRRLGTTRSRLALIERYKARCEWHDRDRLHTLADDTNQPEHALRDELTRYLFDAGLNPLSEAVLGTASRADVFGPHPGFFVEAKQYTDGNLEAQLRGAFRQALDTAGNLHGSGYDLDEAFIVLFRRSGPRALLPREPVHADGLRWHLILINIAPPDADASKNKLTPIEYTPENLREMLLAERPTT